MVARFIPSTAGISLLSLLLFTTHTSAVSPVYIGCYSSSEGLSEVGTYQFQSSGYCQGQCLGNDNQAVLGLTAGNDCYCGGQLPPTSDKVDDSKCSSICTGYGEENCGGNSYWSVYGTGAESQLSSVDGTSGPGAQAGGQQNAGKSSAASNTATATSSKPSVVTSISPGKTVIVTQSPTIIDSENKGSSNGSSGGGGGSKTGVIVGVIVGVIALIAIGVALWFFLVYKKRREADAEANTGPASAGGMAETPKEWRIPAAQRQTQYGRPGGGDSRLDNQAGNRASSYSLDDSNDYTRKILTVANPDR